MSDKDLGEGIEDFENEIENLKNKELRLFGIKVTAVTIGMAFSLVSAGIGSLYGAFVVYQDYMDMRAQIQEYVAPDLSGFQEQISVIDEKMNGVLAEVRVMKDSMNQTGDRVSDIKNDLREDLVRMEKIIDQVEDQTREVENKVRDIVQNAEERFENKRDALQNDYDQAKDRLQTNTSRELKDLEDRLNKRLQQALDNPLAN
jgi:chromosome segregation ATPase